MNVSRTALKGVTFYNPTKADDGYTLFCPVGRSTWGDAVSNVWLINMKGYIVHRWRMENIAGIHGILLPNGNLLYPKMTKTAAELGLTGIGTHPNELGGFGGEIVEVDWDDNVVWRLECPYQNHDFLPLPNGHIMYPTYGDKEEIVPDELAARWKGGLPGTELNGKILSDYIYEKDRDGNTVWKWISHEHLDPEIDAICPSETRSHFHFNSLWLCRDGGILVSPRHLNEVFKIEYPSGKVIARYGRGKIFHQHDARELDNGNILVFDNGSHRHSYEPNYSRAVEMDPNTDEVVWEYKAEQPSDFYSSICSGAERLPNGNTVICESTTGRFFEVTYEGELVWEYVSPFMSVKQEQVRQYGNTVFRAHRYPRDYPGLKGKDLDPARFPWENRFFGPAAFKKDFKPCIF